MLALSDTLFVDEMTKDIEQFNKLVPAEKQIRVKTENRPFNFDWKIPEEYLKLDLDKYVVECLLKTGVKGDELKVRVQRVIDELELYEQDNLRDVLRVLIYVINTLNSNNVVWGVGRGSSVSSYVLFLIGVHDVDSVKYDLDIEDFIH